MAPDLVLRDIHSPPTPPWWPPAPGWWLVAGVVLLALAFVLGRHWRRARARRRAEAVFDRALAQATSPTQRIAAMSELLRRAARTRVAGADRLQGEDWLACLDAADPARPFSDGIGRALLDGGFRRDAGDLDIDALQALARARFLGWTAPR
ncbi:DUF4381 domain-containing protein [Luteimonas aestuarii]|uniref:DUF4381 domain-containing protein n=1 Tax=Luteimonas aestuarii TaxID=453837 RepID=A0A4R5TL54_9GAMM|nr:DUF4381 domain-containing protein [Luteimonas aestuarii]TDK23300.1 DUF4381 domain-containing protein [Luteimonas aestuarii]